MRGVRSSSSRQSASRSSIFVLLVVREGDDYEACGLGEGGVVKEDTVGIPVVGGLVLARLEPDSPEQRSWSPRSLKLAGRSAGLLNRPRHESPLSAGSFSGTLTMGIRFVRAVLLGGLARFRNRFPDPPPGRPPPTCASPQMWTASHI